MSCNQQCGSILDQGAGQLGGMASLGDTASPWGTPQYEASLLSLSGENRAQTRTLTLDLVVKYRQIITAGLAWLLRANIRWGSAKGHSEAVIDIRNGGRVVIEGTSLTVGVAMVSSRAAIAVNGPNVDIFASVGHGSVGKGPPLTYTEQEQVVALSGTSGVFAVPPFASEVELQADYNPWGVIA